MSISPLVFTGVSQYSSDFQTILTRAVQIAQIPVQQLQNKDSDALQRKSLLGGLATAVSGLSDALGSLGKIAAGSALSASSSDPTAVAVSNTSATNAASYTIDSITSAASAATERTTAGFADSASTPVSSSGTVDLVVGSNHHKFTLTNNSLTGIRDWINGLGAGVSASILTTNAGNYLSVNANSTGATTLKLVDNPDGTPANLLTSTNQGTNAAFKLNGIDISQAGNVVNSVIPGVTFSILKASTSPVTLTLASDPSQLSSALQNFVSAYNTAHDSVSAQIGAGAGLLSGDTVVTQLSSQFRQIASYQAGSGLVKNLANLGVEFDSTGKASFNASTFNALPANAIADAFTFIGSASSGLGKFSGSLAQFSDPISGIIQTEQQGLDRTDKSLQNQIAALNDRITVMQNSLAARLHSADALLATLASQQQQLTASLQGLNLTLYGKNQTAL